MSEATFTVRVDFDPDDDDQIQTANFADALELHVAGLMGEGYCVGYTIADPDGKERKSERD
jgi:hypothetical protein